MYLNLLSGFTCQLGCCEPNISGTLIADGHPVQKAEEGQGGGAAQPAGEVHPDAGAALHDLHH